MKVEVKNYNVKVGNNLPTQIMISFDSDEQDPVIHFLKGGNMWALDLANASSLFWEKGSTILDIGGHIGTYSLIAASITENKVIAVEASPQNFRFLKNNKDCNGFDNLTVHNVAAGSEEGTLQFTGGGSGGHVLGDQSQNGVEVKCVKLDDLLGNLEALDFIKMDIEGFEIEAIKGARTLLNKFEPVILFECNGHTLKFFNKTPNDLFEILENEFGYSLFLLNGGLVQISYKDPFPFGVCDLFALKAKHIGKVAGYIKQPLTPEDIKKGFEDTRRIGNEDIQRYLDWYIAKQEKI